MIWVASSLGSPVTISQGVTSVTEMLTGIDSIRKAKAQVVRIIGSWSLRCGTSDSLTEVHCGIWVPGEEEIANPPNMELDNRNYMYNYRAQRSLGDTVHTGDLSRQYDIDVKPGLSGFIRSAEHKVAIAFLNASSAAASAIVSYGLRILLRLP